MLGRYKGKAPVYYAKCIAQPAASFSHRAIKHGEISCDREMKNVPQRQIFASHCRPMTVGPLVFSSRKRDYSTDTKEGGNTKASEPESLFNSQESAWDHVFQGIDELPPLASMPVQAHRRSSSGALSHSHARQQSMTAREIEAFNSMFSMIFEAATKQQQKAAFDASATGRPRTAADRRADRAARHDPLSGVGIGSTPDGTNAMSDLFGKLRRVSRKFRWSPQEDADLERKMQQMELCDSDQQLLEWAAKEVFEESARYEEAARQAVLRQESTSSSLYSAEVVQPKAGSESESKSPEGKPDSPETHNAQPAASPAPESDPSSGPAVTSPLPLQPPFYPHLLAALIRSFRDKFRDPHLALSIFEHARTRSIASYVFGCTVPAYNEVLRTRWEAFRDLRGVADALNEMRVNGIAPNGQTRAFVEELRRDVGARTVWQEERNIGTGEVLGLLNQIEMLSKEPLKKHAEARQRDMNGQKKGKWRTSDEQWKLDDGKQDRDYKFGNWNFPNLKGRFKSKPKGRRQSPSTSHPEKLAFE